MNQIADGEKLDLKQPPKETAGLSTIKGNPKRPRIFGREASEGSDDSSLSSLGDEDDNHEKMKQGTKNKLSGFEPPMNSKLKQKQGPKQSVRLPSIQKQSRKKNFDSPPQSSFENKETPTSKDINISKNGNQKTGQEISTKDSETQKRNSSASNSQHSSSLYIFR